jgi:hypothetical protein
MSNNADSKNKSDYLGSESETESDSESNNSTLTGDSINSDDEEYFVRFDSTTNYDNVDYIMIGSTCYEIPDDNILLANTPILANTSANRDSKEEEKENAEPHEYLGCQHDVLVYFINGYVEQQMMDKNELKDICRLQRIDISSHDIFEHLLE